MGENPTSTTTIPNEVQETKQAFESKQHVEMLRTEYYGTVSDGEITNVKHNPTENVFVEFVLELPTGETGTISFSEWQYEDGRVDEFLEQAGCSVETVESCLGAEIPVVCSEKKGWQAMYGDMSLVNGPTWVELSDERGDFTLSNDAHMVTYLAAIGVMAAASPLATEPSGAMMMILLGAVTIGFGFFCSAAWLGITSPKYKNIKNTQS